MKPYRVLKIKLCPKSWRYTALMLLVIFVFTPISQPARSIASSSLQNSNRIILPSDGKVTVNFIGTGVPGDWTACEGDFGLYSPQQILIYPEYLRSAGVSFPLPSYFSQGGKVNAYFDHQYPTYSNSPNASFANTVNFYGYDSGQTNPSPPYNVVYNGHDGVDYLISNGTPVLAAASGQVIFAGQISGYCGLTKKVRQQMLLKCDTTTAT